MVTTTAASYLYSSWDTNDWEVIYMYVKILLTAVTRPAAVFFAVCVPLKALYGGQRQKVFFLISNF